VERPFAGTLAGGAFFLGSMVVLAAVRGGLGFLGPAGSGSPDLAPWLLLEIRAGVPVAVVAGFVAGRVGRASRAPRILAGVVLLLGLVEAAALLRAAASGAVLVPTLLAVVAPFAAAAGVLLGGAVAEPRRPRSLRRAIRRAVGGAVLRPPWAELARWALPVAVLAGAAIVAGATWIVNDTLVIRAKHYVERPEDEDKPDIVFRGGSFWYHRGRTIYNIRRAEKERGQLYGVTVYERDESDRLVRSIHAERARIMGPDAWQLDQAIIRRFDPDRPDQPPGFQRSEQLELSMAGDPDLGLLEADPEWLSVADLRRYIEAQTRDGEDTSAMRTRLQRRFAAPFTVFLFAMLAIPAALQAERTRSLAAPAIQGMALLLAFSFLNQFAGMVSERGLAATWVSWLVVGGFLAFGAYRAQRVPA